MGIYWMKVLIWSPDFTIAEISVLENVPRTKEMKLILFDLISCSC